jgi:hypothetical protein
VKSVVRLVLPVFRGDEIFNISMVNYIIILICFNKVINYYMHQSIQRQGLCLHFENIYTVL